MKNNLMLSFFIRVFVSICLFLNFLSIKVTAEMVPSCLSSLLKETTIQQFVAVKRTYGCRNSLDFQACQLSLGLSVGTAMGAAAAIRVRSPNFHFCPMKTSSLFLYFFSPDLAWAGAPLCQGIESLIQNQASNAIATSQKDLDRQVENYKNQKKILNQQRNALNKNAELLYFETNKDLINRQLQMIEQSHPKWNEFEKSTKALDEKFIEWKIAKKRGDQALAASIASQREKIRYKIQSLTQEIRSANDYKLKYQEYNLASKEHYDFIKDPTIAKVKAAEIEMQIQKIDGSLNKILREKLELAAIQKKLYKPFLQSDELQKILDEIYVHGASSPKSYEQIRGLQMMEKGREGLVFSASRAKGVFSQRYRDLQTGKKGIGKMGVRLGLVGTALGMASAAASADDLSHATESLLLNSTPVPISSVGCGEMNKYFSYENVDNRCRPDLSLDRQGPSAFFQLSEEDMLKEVQSDPKLCTLIQSGFQESFQKHESVKCGPTPRINYANGNFVEILSISPGNPLQKIQWRDGGKTYTMAMKNNHQVDSVHVLNWVGSSYKGDDPVALEAQQNFHSKFLSDVVETLACCDSKGVRPTDQECQKKGISQKASVTQGGSSLDSGPHSSGTK